MIALFILAICVGVVLLTVAADKFIAGASDLALKFHISPLTIGLTIVALGTSAPEMMVSATASYLQNPGIAIGNVVGSNIMNIALVLGATALISPIVVNAFVLKEEFPALVLISLAASFLLYDGVITYSDVVLLYIGLVAFLFFLWKKRNKQTIEAPKPHPVNLKKAIFMLVFGLIGLSVASRILVWGAVGLAQYFGVSDLIIGLTIVAIGTSLPELAASVMGALRGKDDLALGNIIGSNIFNLLAVLPLAGLFGPASVDPDLFNRDIPIMIGLTLLLWLMSFTGYYKRREKHILSRPEGAFLLTFAAGYLGYLCYSI